MLYDVCGVILYVCLVCIVCVCVVSSVDVYFPGCIQCSVVGRGESGGFSSRRVQWSLNTLGVVPRQKRTIELQESNYTSSTQVFNSPRLLVLKRLERGLIPLSTVMCSDNCRIGEKPSVM